jgi:hypothetical protein
MVMKGWVGEVTAPPVLVMPYLASSGSSEKMARTLG